MLDAPAPEQAGRSIVTVVALLCVLGTAAALLVARGSAEEAAQGEFDTAVHVTLHRVEDQFDAALRPLESVRALFAASVSVERGEWRSFCR